MPRIGFADARDPRVQEAVARMVDIHRLSAVLVGADVPSVPDGVAHVLPEHGASDVDCLADLVAAGSVDAGVGGSLTSSPAVIRAGITRLRGPDLVSGCFAIDHDGEWTTYADCVVIPDPDAAQLSQIAASAADHHRRTFRVEPRVAMLSFSTGGSATHPRVSLVQEATRLLRIERPDLLVDGEVQFDVAIDPVVAARKAPASPIAGSANVLVFPSLESANIAYKVAERVGGATALGSFVLGLRRPWVDLSRGCSVDDIVHTALLVAQACESHTASSSLAG